MLKQSYNFVRHAVERRTHSEHFIVADKAPYDVLLADGLMNCVFTLTMTTPVFCWMGKP